MNALPETDEREPRHVPRVVPADHVQPSPDRPGRHGDVRAAVPRSVQLQLRPACIPAAIDLDRRRSCTTRFIAEGKPGVDDRARASTYSTWWNGGLRTTAYFHNMIGILTETIGNPTPTQHSVHAELADRRLEHLVADRAAGGLALPAVDRLLDHGQPRGARLRVALPRDELLYNIYTMGKRRDQVGQRGPLDVHAARSSTRVQAQAGGSRRPRRRRRRGRGGAAAAAAAAAVAAGVAADAAAATRSTPR